MTETTQYQLKHVEADKFSVKVFVHDMPNGPATVPCWTFISEGFETLGQKEFVFTLRRRINEDAMQPPWEIIDVFKSIYSLAKEGEFIDVGGMTYIQNAESGFFGHTELIGFAYTLPQHLPGVEIDQWKRYLLAILLVPGEAEFSEKLGSYRVLARLGRNAFYFPCPPWSDRSRKAMITREDCEESLLTKAPIIHFNKSYIELSAKHKLGPRDTGTVQQIENPRGTATLFIHPDNEREIGEVLTFMGQTPDTAIVITLIPAEHANAQLVYDPVDAGTGINNLACSDSLSITGGFVSLAVGSELNQNGRFLEDGFFFSMGSPLWADIYEKLSLRKTATISESGPGGLGLTIKFLSQKNKPWWRFWQS